MDVFWRLRRLFGTRDGALPKQAELEWTATDQIQSITGAAVQESVEPALDEAVPCMHRSHRSQGDIGHIVDRPIAGGILVRPKGSVELSQKYGSPVDSGSRPSARTAGG
jgi:hypothetical protein